MSLSLEKARREARADGLLARVKINLSSTTAIIADIVGAVGLPILIREGLGVLHPTPILGIKIDDWAWTLGLLPFVLLVVWALGQWIADLKKTAKNLEEEREALEVEMQEIRRRKNREAQKQAMRRLSHIFGFHLKLRRHHYTIYGNGSASCRHTVQFLCNRRALGEWSRTAISSRVKDLPGSYSHDIQRGFHASKTSRPFSQGDKKGVVERFHFQPTLQAQHGPVELIFEEKVPEATFMFVRPPELDRKFDYASARTNEPVELLEIIVVFHGCNPGDFSADAVYGFGPDQSPLAREIVEANEVLKEEFEQSGYIKTTLSIKYPVIGVSYQIRWALAPESPPQSKALNPKTTAPSL